LFSLIYLSRIDRYKSSAFANKGAQFVLCLSAAPADRLRRPEFSLCG
jgi:hypothetical protein